MVSVELLTFSLCSCDDYEKVKRPFRLTVDPCVAWCYAVAL